MSAEKLQELSKKLYEETPRASGRYKLEEPGKEPKIREVTFNWVDIIYRHKPQAILQVLRESTFNDILVPEGESLGFKDITQVDQSYYGFVDAPAEISTLADVVLRINKFGEIYYPEIHFWWRNGGAFHISLYDHKLHRRKSHTEYVETGYEGHDYEGRDATEYEETLFYQLCREISRT